MELLTLGITILVLGAFSWFQYKWIERFIRAMKEQPKVTTSPNEVSDEEANTIDLTEETLANIPPDVKFEVEGGDSFIPPGFSETIKV